MPAIHSKECLSAHSHTNILFRDKSICEKWLSELEFSTLLFLLPARPPIINTLSAYSQILVGTLKKLRNPEAIFAKYFWIYLLPYFSQLLPHNTWTTFFSMLKFTETTLFSYL